MQIRIKTEEEIDLIRQSSLLVGKTLGEISRRIGPGVNTLELDRVAEEFIRDHGGIPAFKNYQNNPEVSPYPYTLCISVNDEVVHGMPGPEKILKEGDVASVDCGVLMNGYFGDSAFTFGIGEIAPSKKRLLTVTRESLMKGIEKAIAGNTLGDIGHAIQYHVETNGFSVVQEMVGHGIGKDLHEPPEIPNYGKKGKGVKLEERMVFAIEPMVNQGRRKIFQARDGWTILTADRSVSAHFEHTVVIRKDKAEILSTFETIEIK
jgi:methionyl aminopeptidase